MLSGPNSSDFADRIGERADYTSLCAMFEGTAQRHGDRGVYIYDTKGGNEFRSYRQLFAETERAAAAMARKGFTEGDRLLLAIPTSFEFIHGFFGALALSLIHI